MKRLRILLAAVTVVVLAGAAWAAPAFDKALPDGTLLFVTIRDVPALQK